jgi:UDP-GlcNAc:undecaprenyl-phosphate/decaprenyl-phosphate GlcNAc-1-phosphate transferase
MIQPSSSLLTNAVLDWHAYLIGFSLALVLGLILTPLARRLAIRVGAMDIPGEARKIHTQPIARFGGPALFLAFLIAVLFSLPLHRELLALILATTVLLAVGAVDDIRGLDPWIKLVWQIVAAAIALAGGIGITQITNPFGGVLDLTMGRFPIDILGLHFHITPIANALSILWIVGLINAINFLDGLDGLSCGVSAIAAIVMFALSLAVGQPEVALLAIILAGAALGFLPYNFFPAKIFLGDGGAYFLGLTLALIAIYSGGKLATATLVLGFTIIDGLWAVLRRLYHRSSPFKADRGHLHHLLLEAGLSQRRAVLLLYAVALAFGLTALAFDSFAKLISLVVLFIMMAVLITTLMAISWRRTRPSAGK